MKNKLNFFNLKLKAAATPVQVTKDEVIYYGEKNEYFNYLIDLYLNSSKHSAIINRKARYILGSGFESEVREKSINDYLIFGGFALFISRDVNGNITNVEHLNFANIRKLEDENYIAVSKHWCKRTGVFKYVHQRDVEYKKYPIFSDTEIFPVSVFVFENLVFNNEYPLPSYVGASQYIELDYRVCNFWNNSVSKGFTPSHIINMVEGNMTEEEKQTLEASIQDKFGGDDRAGTFILNLIRNKDQATDIQVIPQQNTDQLMNLLNNAIQQEIFISHSVISPTLFGVRVAGQLGGRDEIVDAYTLFKNTEMLPLRLRIDNQLKKFIGDYEIKDVDAFTEDWASLKGILTIDEIREKLGYSPLTQEVKSTLDNETKLKAAKLLKERNVIAFSKYLGSARDVEGKQNASDEIKFLVKFAEVSDYEYDALKWLSRDATLSTRDLAHILGVTVDALALILKKLKAQNYLDANGYLTSKGLGVIQDKSPFVTEMRYSYEWAMGFGAKDKKTSRDFCKEMLSESTQRKSTNQLWTREDIDAVSDEVGWDVWAMRGGWYRVPNTEVSIPHCRHIWQQHVVISKKQK